jgi:hypothetical protein
VKFQKNIAPKLKDPTPIIWSFLIAFGTEGLKGVCTVQEVSKQFYIVQLERGSSALR